VPAYAWYVGLIVTTLPALVIVAVTHLIARVLRRVNWTDYAAIGAGVAMLGACTLTTAIYAPVLLTLSAVVGAIMGGGYRRLAGLEPMPLPKPVQVVDPATLVGADHLSRRMRVMTGK
jgi:hypothetical protein